MKSILFPDKHESNPTKTKIFDLNFKLKGKKYNNISNEYIPNKKSERSNINNDDSSIKLTNAYKNINLMLSNCLETIRAEEKEETHKNFLNNDINVLLKKNEHISSLLKEGKKQNLNKSLTISNSNILLNVADDNILNNLNINKVQEKKHPYKLNKKKFGKSISLNNCNNINLKIKLSSLLNKNNLSSFSTKRSKTKNKKNIFFSHKKNEKEFDINKDKILSKLEKKNFSTSKLQRVKKDKDINNISIISSKLISTISSKSLKRPVRSKKSLVNYKKFKKSNTSIHSAKDFKSEKSSNEKKSCKKFKLNANYLSSKNLSNYSEKSEGI